MTEKDLAEDYRMVLHEAKSMGCSEIKALYNIPLKNMEMIVQALEEVQQYHAIGTPEELQTMKEHGGFTGIELANIAAMQMKLKEYEAIGTLKECLAAIEKQNVNKELESHDEKYILECCISLMQEVVNEFSEWYRWQHGDDAIEKLDEKDRFCFRKSYFRIVQELFLLGTPFWRCIHKSKVRAVRC